MRSSRNLLVPRSLPQALRHLLVAAGAFGLVGGASAQALPDHSAFTTVLEEVVVGSRVDYPRLVSLRSNLDAYLSSLASVTPAALDASPDEERLAFWINAYNACMLKLVAEHYPLDEGGGPGIVQRLRNRFAGYSENSVWQIPDVFTGGHCGVAGETRSQDEIEHEIIRPRFQEPRIHFAVNCAARSCPVLWPEAYVGSRMDDQLDRAVHRLISNPRHFRLERGAPGGQATLHLNKVLDWYRDDFGGIEGLKEFFAGYLNRPAAEIVRRSDTEVRFFEYDWTLNDATSGAER